MIDLFTRAGVVGLLVDGLTGAFELRLQGLDALGELLLQPGFDLVGVGIGGGQDAVILTYTAAGLPPDGARLELRPMLAYRDFHRLQQENDAVLTGVERDLVAAIGLAREHAVQGLPQGVFFICIQI